MCDDGDGRTRRSRILGPMISAAALLLGACEPDGTPKTASERACALNAIAKFRTVEVISTTISDHDPYEVARAVISDLDDAKDAIEFTIQYGFYDLTTARVLRTSSHADYEGILLKVAAPNFKESKGLQLKVRSGGVSGTISAFCAVSHLGDIRTGLGRGIR